MRNAINSFQLSDNEGRVGEGLYKYPHEKREDYVGGNLINYPTLPYPF